MSSGRLLTRNLQETRTEMAFSVFAYNVLRILNLAGPDILLAKLR